jgi:hypothetical protein
MQIKTLVGILYSEVIPSKRPRSIETKRTARVIEDFEITGSLDLEECDETISDLKTGKLGCYHGQLGEYSLLKKAHTGTSAGKLIIDHVPRFKLSKPYPGTQKIEYDVAQCEIIAHSVTQRIVSDVKRFQKTANPWCFMANPMSMMCSKRYCPAWGSNFCEFGVKK